MAWQWKNRVETLWQREVRNYMDIMSEASGIQYVDGVATGPPIGQLSTTGGSPQVISPGDVLNPMLVGWGRNTIVDKVNGTIIVPAIGVYGVTLGVSGTLTSPQAQEFFSIRLNGTAVITIGSNQQQAAEGVEASLVGFARVTTENSVVDVTLDSTSTDAFTMQQIIFSVTWKTTFAGVVEV